MGAMLAARSEQSAGMLSGPSLLVVATLTAATTALGGFLAAGQRLVAALLAIAVVWAARTQRMPTGPIAAPLLGAAGLAAWAVISATVAGSPRYALSTVALLAGMVVVVLICRQTTASQRQALAGAALGIGVLVALSGWVGVAWRLVSLALPAQDLWRAATTLSYANAAAGLLAPLTVLALARLVAAPHRALGAVIATILGVGLGATLSRAGFFALAVGLVLLVGALGLRRIVRAAAGPAVAAAVALAALSPSIPAAASPRPVLAAAGLLVGVVLAAGMAWLNHRAILLCVVATAAAGLLVLGVGGLSEGNAVGAIGHARLTVASPGRAGLTQAALKLTAERPLTGMGPGEVSLTWRSDQGQITVPYAHNEYLQTLLQLGVVGLVLLLALLIAVARVVWRARAAAPSPELWAGAAAGLAALAVHSAFDFLWHIPAIPLVAAVLFALTYPATQPQPTKAIRTPAGPPASKYAPATCRDPVAGAADQ